MIICRESDQKLKDKSLPICLFHKWVPWDIWSWKKSELPLTNSTKLWNGISADWLLNGLAGFTGFFSTNQPSIITSAAIPVLQEAPPGMMITGPGMSPWPVAAELVHVAEAAWGRPITIKTLVHFCMWDVEIQWKISSFALFSLFSTNLSTSEKKIFFIQNHHIHHQPNIQHNRALENGNIQHNRGLLRSRSNIWSGGAVKFWLPWSNRCSVH